MFNLSRMGNDMEWSWDGICRYVQGTLEPTKILEGTM